MSTKDELTKEIHRELAERKLRHLSTVDELTPAI